MKQRKQVIAIAFLSGLWMIFMGSPIESGQAKNPESAHRGTSMHMSSKAKDDSRAQWFADPKRGWVRVDEGRGDYDASRSRPKDGKSHKHKEKGGKTTNR